MKKKIQIFISSTYIDLIEERQAAVSAILKAGHIPAGMELFTAGDESQMETIKRWIDESDVFMLILGGRYGAVEPTTSLSYTELEYDYAINSGKRCFAVVIEESALEKKVKEKGSWVIETENPKELSAFRKKVLSRISAFFSNVQDIRLAVHETISDFLARHDFKGWVSGDEIPDIQTFTDQINSLRTENKRLAEDRDALHAGAVFTPSEEREFNHIRQKLDRTINLHHSLHRKEEGENTSTKIGKEVYKANLLSTLIKVVGEGKHRFNIHSIEHLLYEELNKSNPPTGAPEIRRVHGFGSIKENLALELQTCGLDRFVEVDTHRPSRTLCEFTEKMYRFVYWLDYNGYTPEIRFEFVSMTEEVIAVAPAPKPLNQADSPVLTTTKAIDSSLGFKAQYKRWHTTEEGVVSAQREFTRLCEELERQVSRINSASKNFKLDFSGVAGNQCRISGIGVSFSVTWFCKHSDTLSDSVLSVIGDRARFDLEGVQSFKNEQDKFYNDEYDIDMKQNSELMWKRRRANVSLTTTYLATNLLNDLLGEIQNRVLHESEEPDDNPTT